MAGAAGDDGDGGDAEADTGSDEKSGNKKLKMSRSVCIELFRPVTSSAVLHSCERGSDRNVFACKRSGVVHNIRRKSGETAKKGYCDGVSE